MPSVSLRQQETCVSCFKRTHLDVKYHAAMFPPAVVVGLILVKREQFTIFDLTKVGSAVCSFNDGRNSV